MRPVSHSIGEFLFSSTWKPSDTDVGGGKVGAAIFIYGSILTCFLTLVIAIPFSLSTAVFMTQISPKIGEKIIRPAVEIFVGIPSVVYGWVGLVVRAVRAGGVHCPFRHDLSYHYFRFCRCHPERE